MPVINPYLNFDGNAEEAFNFYKSVFGSELMMLMRFKDTPEAGKFPESEQDRIMHVALPIGSGNILMASDMSDTMGQKIVQGNNFYISVSTGSKEEADKIYNGLSEGGTIEVPIADAFWGAYFGMLKDKFGIKWMVSFDKNRPQ